MLYQDNNKLMFTLPLMTARELTAYKFHYFEPDATVYEFIRSWVEWYKK